MEVSEFRAWKKTIDLSGGTLAYADTGEGPAALFVHGVFMNGLLWANAITEVRSERRCLAVDLPSHGDTTIELGEGFSLEEHADLLVEFLDALGIDKVDLVGNDTGGAICQVFAVRFPERLRSLALTNCDVHENFPPDAFKPNIELAQQGQLASLITQIATDPELARTEVGLGVGYQYPERLTEEKITAFLGRYTEPEIGKEIEERVAAVADKDLTFITADMRKLTIPTLVVWGTNDDFFDVKWAYWLRDNVPGVTEVVEVDGGKLFFVDERADELTPHLAKHWQAALGDGG